MRPDEIEDARETQSRMEAIAYIEAMLPDMITLAMSEPTLKYLLQVAHEEAKAAVRRMPAFPNVIKDAALTG